jgi:3-oxoacyl-[acyl-carrier protein] reductase
MKYALVTGGSRGIGRAACLKLAEQGYSILINYKSNEKEANVTREEVLKKNVSAETLQFDVADKAAIERVLGGWMEKNPEHIIEVLVNNAGIRQDTLMLFMNDDQWDSVIDSSLHGFYHVTRAVLKSMVSKRYGRIVNVVSLSGLNGMAGQTNYSAAKAAVIGATKALAQEVAKRNVTVNAVAPGFIKTDMTVDLPEDQIKAIIPMQRFGTPDEVADAIAFLASPKASYITGSVLSITGGIS